MIVSWEWLREYVEIPHSVDDVIRRLTMSGLNHESTTTVGTDLAIDLEVTSNRADCLGHVGVAREISVLFGSPLRAPSPQPKSSGPDASSFIRVRIDCPQLCPRYTARVLRNVRIGPSPAWMVRRLATLGVNSVNNIVDATNYVLFECGQPLHAFDLDQISGNQIIVRAAENGEAFVAIDHRTYTLGPSMCVIADARRGVAIGGVMGGAESEVSASTRNVLLESAQFAPLAIRTTANRLNLHSPSSFRFERGVDPEGIEWASRRCCEIILDLAGGELASGIVEAVAVPPPRRDPITLRLSQIPRLLGIEIDPTRVREILLALGLQPTSEPEVGRTIHSHAEPLKLIPPSWRRDLTREVDLIEEVARIHGYENIPDNVPVPLSVVPVDAGELAVDTIRHLLAAAGMFEAMTASVIPREWSDQFSPWCDEPALTTCTPMLLGADTVRRSLIPSLLAARAENEKQGNIAIELFELAKAYWPRVDGLPTEPEMLALVSGREFRQVKGVIEQIHRQMRLPGRLEFRPADLPLVAAGRGASIHLAGERVGVIGEVEPQAWKKLKLRDRCVVAELMLNALIQDAELIPQFRPHGSQPAVTRDLNLVLPESVLWAQLESSIEDSAGEHLEELLFREVYRDPERDGAGHKRILVSLVFRAAERTLTGEEVDLACQRVVTRCQEALQARLLA